MTFHIGVDVGGTKLLAAALNSAGEILSKYQVSTPRHDYTATLDAIMGLIEGLENELGGSVPVGVGIPGSVRDDTGQVQNANSTWLNGKSLKKDLQQKLGREVRLANDANCFALSEAIDGAGVGAASVFGVILGTGVGGGLVLDGKLIEGHRSIAGEWGHCPLPYATIDEMNLSPTCWCGRRGCIESWLSGPALTGQYNQSAGTSLCRVEEIIALKDEGDLVALDLLDAHSERLARSLALVVNIFDPEVIVLGGGLSGLGHFYKKLPDLMSQYIFSDEKITLDIRPPRYGAASGVRGAARLWPFAD